jgi:hypothetical protein
VGWTLGIAGRLEWKSQKILLSEQTVNEQPSQDEGQNEM